MAGTRFCAPRRGLGHRSRTVAAVAPALLVACAVYGALPVEGLGRSTWFPCKKPEHVDSLYGTTLLAQCGVPVSNQLSAASSNWTGSPPEWITLTDHSISLVPIDGNQPTKQWAMRSFSGLGSTNWGSDLDGKKMKALGYLNYVGPSTEGKENDVWEFSPHSHLDMGYISYYFGDNMDIRENTFLWRQNLGGYYLNGCANYAVGQTSVSEGYDCPAKPVQPGSFKFSVLGTVSGSLINSNDSASWNQTLYDAMNQTGTVDDSVDNQYKDMAEYKTLLYSTTLDVGSMVGNGSSMFVRFENGTEKNFTDVGPDEDLAGASLHMAGAEGIAVGSEVVLSFTPTYSTGHFTRDYDAMVTEFGSLPCDNDNKGMDYCLLDVTGYNTAPDSFPIYGNPCVRKLGNGGLDELPQTRDARTCVFGYEGYSKATVSPATTKEELAGLGGAPTLNVTEVRRMKVTLRAHRGCTNRPAIPLANDPTGMANASWPDGPDNVDCPWSWRATRPNSDGIMDWAVTNENGYEPHEVTDCPSGACYIIDFHLALVDEETGERTALGSPENDPQRGFLKGSFFIYYPGEVTTSSNLGGTGGGDTGGGDTGGTDRGGDVISSASSPSKPLALLSIVALAAILPR